MSESWSKLRVGDFCVLAAGGTPDTNTPDYWEGGDIPWMSSGEVHDQRIRRTRSHITEKGLRDSSAKFFPIGSVLVALAGQGKTRGKVAISEIELTTNQSIAAIVADKGVCEPEFLFYNLDSRYEELRTLSGGSGRAGLNLSILSDVEISLPPLPEQRKIAEVLSGIDEQLSNLIRKEQHCLQILNAIALDAFADSLMNKTTLGELADFHGGRAFKSGELTESGMKVTRISNLHKPDFPYWRYNGQFNPKILAKDGDILFSWAGVANSINVHRYKGEDTLLNQHIYNFKFENELIKEWTYWVLKNMLPSLRKQIEGGAGQLHLTKGFIQAIEIPIVDSEKMSSLCASFRSAESLATFLRSKQRKLNFLKSALCDDLLSGRKRVSI